MEQEYTEIEGPAWEDLQLEYGGIGWMNNTVCPLCCYPVFDGLCPCANNFEGQIRYLDGREFAARIMDYSSELSSITNNLGVG